MVDFGRQRRKVTRLDCHEFGQRAIVAPVGDPEDSLPDSQTGGPITQLDNHPGDLVAGNGRRPVTPGPVGPGARPVEFARGEACRVHPHDDVVLGSVGVGHPRQRQPVDTGSAVTRDDRLHRLHCACRRALGWRRESRDVTSCGSSMVIMSTPGAQMHTARKRLQPVASKFLI